VTDRPAAAERARVRGPLWTAAALAWALLVVDVVAGPGHGAHPGAGPLSAASALVGWLLMVIAMGAPLLVGPVEHVRARSLRRSRARACAGFLVGYAAVWTLGGIGLLALAAVVAPFPLAVAAGLLLWWATPARQRCLNRRHRHPALPAFGQAAVRATVRFGAAHGFWCFGTCAAPMLLALVLPPTTGPATMAATSAWLVLESVDPPRRPTWGIAVPRLLLGGRRSRWAASLWVRAAAAGGQPPPVPRAGPPWPPPRPRRPAVPALGRGWVRSASTTASPACRPDTIWVRPAPTAPSATGTGVAAPSRSTVTLVPEGSVCTAEVGTVNTPVADATVSATDAPEPAGRAGGVPVRPIVTG